MNIQEQLKKAIRSVDGMLARLSLSVIREEGVLLSFVFHSVFRDAEELEAGTIDPQQGVTLNILRRFIYHFQVRSYQFVSPQAILEGLSPRGKYVLLTFDDGYSNNLRALPVLEECNVPAVFFISSDHVLQGKAFWWDVVFREFKKRDGTNKEISRANAGYKRLKTDQVESLLREEFGESALRLIGDLDRPFTPAELKDFAAHRLVHIGNHTKDHAILTNYSRTQIQEQIVGCQKAIQQVTGKAPKVIAYPNGNDSPEIWEAAQEAGLRLGMSARPGRNRLPLVPKTLQGMFLKRFVLWGNCDVDLQCAASRSRVSLYRMIGRIRSKYQAYPDPMRPAEKEELFARSPGL